MQKHRLLRLLVCLFFILCSFSCSAKKKFSINSEPIVQTPIKEKIKNTKKAEEKTICITGVGDIMLGTNFPSSDYLPPNNGKDLLFAISDVLKKSDITFGNLECSFLNSGKCIKACSDPKKCYAFRMPEHYVDNLKKAGFNLLSIANNHIGDFGITGREKTIEILTKNKINFAGLDTHPISMFTKNGIKFGFCAFAPNVGTPDLRDIEKACQIVKNLADLCDIVIVSFHGGAEGAENQHVTRETEMFYGENRGNVYEFSHKVIDAGADIVFGHGPHISRAVELYKNRFITYSMGNFCTYARFNLKGLNGIAPVFKIYLDKNGAFVSGKLIPIFQAYKKGPIPDKNRLAIKEIIELTSTDFPETNLIIGNDGFISRPRKIKF